MEVFFSLSFRLSISIFVLIFPEKMTTETPAKIYRKLLQNNRNEVRQIYRNPDGMQCYLDGNTTFSHSRRPPITSTPTIQLKSTTMKSMASSYNQQEMIDEEKNDDEHNHTTIYDGLIQDTYHPGLLEDSINNRIDFNNIAFHLTNPNGERVPPPFSPPTTLIDVFHRRVKLEEKKLQENLQGDPKVSDESVSSSNERIDQNERTIETSVLGLDLQATLSERPETELLEAINCLLKAERMNGYDRAVKRAEMNSNLNQSSVKFENITRTQSCIPGQNSYKPLEIISYLGFTKPREMR